VLIKRSDASGNSWRIWDSKRNSYNAGTRILFPDTSEAESTAFDIFDLTSNGFKIRSDGAGINASGGTYIYMALAENPFKYSLAR
jgi:hypothetical protein